MWGKLFWRNIRNFWFPSLQVPSLNIRKKFKKKYNSFLSLGLESSISRNIRHFFRVSLFLFFKPRNFSPEIFNLGARKFCLPKYKKIFFWKNVRNFFRVDFFYFSSLGWKVCQVAPYSTTIIWIFISKRLFESIPKCLNIKPMLMVLLISWWIQNCH